MDQTWTAKQIALAGAVFGGAAGLLLLAGADPSDGSGNDAYRSGQKFGYVTRYALLGAGAAVLAVRFLRPREGTSNGTLALYLGGLAVVLALAVLPPVLDDDKASEGLSADAMRNADTRARFRAEAIDGCVAGVTQRFGRQFEQARFNVDAYCVCLMDKVMAGAAKRGTPLEVIAARVESGDQPGWARRAGDACGRQAAGA